MAERARRGVNKDLFFAPDSASAVTVVAVAGSGDDVDGDRLTLSGLVSSLISRSQLNFDQFDSALLRALVFFANYHVKAAAWTLEKHFEEVEDVES